jgi:hypothetical protein
MSLLCARWLGARTEASLGTGGGSARVFRFPLGSAIDPSSPSSEVQSVTQHRAACSIDERLLTHWAPIFLQREGCLHP